MRRLACLFAILVLMLPCTVSADTLDVSYEFRFNTLTLYGVHSGGKGKQVTGLATKQGVDISLAENWFVPNIQGINQVATGDNGGFVMNMTFGALDEYLDIRMNSSDIDQMFFATDYFLTTPVTVDDITDNSVIIGADVYDLDSSHLVTDRVIDSIKKGGNVMMLKIGGHWYNLLDAGAISSRYLVPRNAVSVDVIKSMELDKWYRNGIADIVNPFSIDE